MDKYGKAILIENSLRNLLQTEEQFAGELQNDLTGTVKKCLKDFSLYGGDVQSQIEYILSNFLHSKFEIDDLADEAVNELCEAIDQLNNYVEKENI